MVFKIGLRIKNFLATTHSGNVSGGRVQQPDETFLLLAESGDYITAENGDRLAYDE